MDMNEQDIAGLLTILCLLPMFLVCLPALFFVQEALLPGLSARSRARLAQAPRRSFLIGLINGVFFFVLAALLGNSGVGLLALLGMLLLATLVFLSVIGFGAVAGTVGRRLFELWARPASAGAQMLIGSVTLEALIFIPFVGWLTLFVLGTGGFGAALLALWRRRGAQRESAEPGEEEVNYA
jgi:hypothetical protein